MKLIAQVKLNPTPEQHAALLATLAEANAACDTISVAAWQAREFRRLPLQKLVYHDIKASFRLGAQILVRCIAKVADAYKLSRKVQRTFQLHGALAFDDRNLTWYTDTSAVSIWTLQGRQYIPYSAGEHQRALLASRRFDAHPHADDGSEIAASATQQLGLRSIAGVHQLQGAACGRESRSGRSPKDQPALQRLRA